MNLHQIVAGAIVAGAIGAVNQYGATMKTELKRIPPNGVKPHTPDGLYANYNGNRVQVIVVGAMDTSIKVSDVTSSLALPGYRLVEVQVMNVENSSDGPQADLAIQRNCALRGYLSMIFERVPDLG